jgi:DNA-directed RNA polymerase subunit RPC12/RpoP
MEVKQIKCPSCGANLEYNYKKHSYTCDYCGASFIDEKDDKTHNPRVELTPDDLKKVIIEDNSQVQKVHTVASKVIIFVFVSIFISIIASFAIVISSFFSFISDFH